MAFRGVRKKPQVVDDDVDMHNTSDGDRDRPGRIGGRLADRTGRRCGMVSAGRRNLRAGRPRSPAAANTDPQRDSIFTKGPTDVLDHATSEIAMRTKLGIDAPHKLAVEGFKRTWAPLIKMDDNTRKKIDALFGKR